MDIESITPEGVRDLLDPVVIFHRDRDEGAVRFRPAYVTGRGRYRQADFDKAIALWTSELETGSQEARAELEVAYGAWNEGERLPSQAQEKVSCLGKAEQLAHACVAAYVSFRYGDIRPYLQPGIPPSSRVTEAYPELQKAFTPRDFLLRVGKNVTPGHAWVSYRDHDIHIHPCLKRGGAHKDLLPKLWRLHSAGLKVEIAVDHFGMCPRGEMPRMVELDRWFGAPFAISEIDNPRAVGAVVHTRTRDISSFEKKGLRTEFWWTSTDDLKTFTVEELPIPEDQGHCPFVLCRFVHSIRDTARRSFVHMDGAVTVYERDAYRARYEQAMNHHQSRIWSSHKAKLFRIDAPEDSEGIANTDWIGIVTAFFRRNELVLEYFSGKSFNDIYKGTYGEDHPAWRSAE